MSYKNKNKYIDLKADGKLFPTWLIANFKKYKLAEIIRTGDPCSNPNKEALKLKLYQEFLGKYMNYNGLYNNILIYHGVGAGKTASTINIYNMLYNYTPGWNVYILIKATLKDDPWMKDLQIWLQEEEKNFRMKNIIFISYDAPNADTQFMNAIKSADTSKKNFYIIDEVHLFIRNVYNNITLKKGKRGQIIYDYIIQDKKDNDATRVICLSGTPAINKPFELALLFNLLKPNAFPKSEVEFNHEYVSTMSYSTLNPARKNNFQRRILGLVSYYIGVTPEYYADKTITYVNTEMSEYQQEIYDYYEKKEKELEKKRRGKIGGTSTYKSYTRQSCNFTFPAISQKITGELRPRPKDYKMSEKDAKKLEEGNNVEKKSETYYNAQNYLNVTEKFIDTFDKYLENIHNEDVIKKHTIVNDMETYKTTFKNDFKSFFDSDTKKSELFLMLSKCSNKFLNCVFNILKSEGPVLVYSNYVLMEGLQIFKIYLKFVGFSQMKVIPNTKDIDENKGNSYLRYTEFHGLIDKKDRKINKDIFNLEKNKYGMLCKIIMISPAGAEGLNLMSVRQVHLIEPHWEEVRMTQMIGRAVRICSHRWLKQEERHVDVFRYKSIKKNFAWTTDQIIEDLAKSKSLLIDTFLLAVRESAIDCVLNKTHNSQTENYKCFQFNEPSLFDDQIGPAYKEDMYDDFNYDDGSNALNSKNIKVKVYKIKAVKKLSPTDEKYSKEQYYWYNPDTGVVYDYEDKYQIGKIGYDNNIPKKLKEDVYIIEKVIPIPMIDENYTN
jgi:superfamily II DNA or RNA helicase